MAKKNQAADTANLVGQLAGIGEGVSATQAAAGAAGGQISGEGEQLATGGPDTVGLADVQGNGDQAGGGDLERRIGAATAEIAVSASPAVAKRVQARVLVDGRFGKINSVVTVTEEDLEGGGGELCAHPASVAYAKGL